MKTENAKRAPQFTIPAVVVALAVTCIPNNAEAGRLDGILRGAAKVADDVPVGSVDSMVERLTMSGAARETIEADLRRAGKLSGAMDDAAVAARRATETQSLLRAATSGFDPTIARTAEKLDPATREAALMICRGGDQVAETIPDLAARGRFLQNAGPDTVAAAGMFGKPTIDSALRLDMALRSGELVRLAGKRAPTVADFGRLMTAYGSSANAFWNRYVMPHWKAWAASGALAWYLIDPDGFMDKAGGLTEEGCRRLTELAGAVTARAIRGTAEGSGSAIDDVARAAADSYFNGWRGALSLIGTVCVLAVVFPRTRRLVLRPFRWLFSVPSEEPRRANAE